MGVEEGERSATRGVRRERGERGVVVYDRKPTFLRQSPSLMSLKLSRFLSGLSLHGSIRSRLCESENHRLSKQGKRLDFTDSILCRLNRVENYECLSFRFEVLLCYDFEDCAVLRENGVKGLLEVVDFDGFFEVADLERKG